MRMVDLIMKTRHGEPLSKNEIEAIVSGFTSGKIPDYQMSAWMMAVCLKGMGAKQTAELTMAMMNSGDTVDLSDLNGIKVDKHSTGGVGDSTTLIAAPLGVLWRVHKRAARCRMRRYCCKAKRPRPWAYRRNAR